MSTPPPDVSTLSGPASNVLVFLMFVAIVVFVVVLVRR